MSDRIIVNNQDLVLKVSQDVDRDVWDEGKYYQFVDRLCGSREYQKEAIFEALRYMLSGQYDSLSKLAEDNWQDGRNEALSAKFQSLDGLKQKLTFADKLSASLDLATGTGKSFVLYAIAVIMLAEGKVDQVLVLCPSTTIEDGLTDKFKELAGSSDLVNLLDAPAPKIINGSESVVAGSICIENYHQILVNSTSSIRDSLKGKGARTLVLNDETHHVYNNEKGDPEKPETIRKWKSFLDDVDFGFRYIIGVSGTCYIKNDYFSDVIYRYSLKQAIEDNFVKKVDYIAKADKFRDSNQRWQVIANRHKEKADELRGVGILPITIVVTQTINGCNNVADEFKEFLKNQHGLSDEQVEEKVLVVHGRSKENHRLQDVEGSGSKIEWIFSVSMLTEGWDVKRVFQIVPHEERAFNSKLLISQVMGRGLRVPDNWPARLGSPRVLIFNHDSWASSVENIVQEVLEYEKKLTSRILPNSPYNLELLNVNYTSEVTKETTEKTGTYKLFEKGYIDLPRISRAETLVVDTKELGYSVGASRRAAIEVVNDTYSTVEVADIMFERLGEEELRDEYQAELPREKLQKIIERSLHESGNVDITDPLKQRFLQALGTIKRGRTTQVRIERKPSEYVTVNTTSRLQYGTASGSSLRKDKFIYYTNETVRSLPTEELEFFDEVLDPTNRYGSILVANSFDFRAPLNFVIADSNPELKFIGELVKPENAKCFDGWIKSTSQGLYAIEYVWRKGEHPRNSSFNPDFFIQTTDRILVVEIKGDEQVKDPDAENIGKYRAAKEHFKVINNKLKYDNDDRLYKFTFLTPASYGPFFDAIRSGDPDSIDKFSSELDIALEV